jgi:hypothetical protein
MIRFIGFIVKKMSGLSSFIPNSLSDTSLNHLRLDYMKAIKDKNTDPKLLKSLHSKLNNAGEAFYHCKTLERCLYLIYRSSLEERAKAAIQERNTTLNTVAFGKEKKSIYEGDNCYPDFSYKTFNDRCTVADGLQTFLKEFRLDICDKSLPWELFHNFKGIFEKFLIQRWMEGFDHLCENSQS